MEPPFDCLILQMKNTLGQKLFMSINHNWNGLGYVLSFPTLYRKDAQHWVSYMAKYLAMEYSDRIYANFTSSAQAITESMEWDATLKKPISATESLCQDIDQISFSWEISVPSSSTPATQLLVNFNNLTISSIDNPPPAQPLLSMAIPTPAMALATRGSSSVNTSGSTHLLVQQLQAQVLAMSGAPPLQMNFQLAPLCLPKTSSATCNCRLTLFLLLEFSSPW